MQRLRELINDTNVNSVDEAGRPLIRAVSVEGKLIDLQ